MRDSDDGERRRRCPGWPAARRMAAAAGVRRRGDDAGWEGPAWACGPAAAAMWSCHVAAPEWSGAPADVSGQAADMSVGGWELFFFS